MIRAQKRVLQAELWRDKGLIRALTNVFASEVSLSGIGIDLGAKAGASSYHRYLRTDDSTTITYADLYPESDAVIELDLMKPFPLKDDSQDFLLLFHVLEHLPNPGQALSECARILRSSGHLYGVVPFLLKIHDSPIDCFRYTETGLAYLLEASGFSNYKIQAWGFGPFTAANVQCVHLLRPRLLRIALTFLAVHADEALNHFWPDRPGVRGVEFPLVYSFVASK